MFKFLVQKWIHAEIAQQQELKLSLKISRIKLTALMGDFSKLLN